MLQKLTMCVLFACVMSTCAVPAGARDPMFALGEVSLVSSAPRATMHVLMEALHTELAAQPFGSQTGRRFVVAARLALLETEVTQPVRSRCIVSLILTARDTGAVFAMAQGKVLVHESQAQRAELVAVQAATRSAFARVWSALRPLSQVRRARPVWLHSGTFGAPLAAR